MSDHDQFTAADAAKEIADKYFCHNQLIQVHLRSIIQKAIDAALSKAASNDERHKKMFGYGLKRAKGGD